MDPKFQNLNSTVNPETTTLSWGNYPDPVEPYEYDENVSFIFMKYILTVISVLACIMVMANNTLLVYAIAKYSRLRTRPNYIILNFAVVTAALSLFCLIESILVCYEYPPKYLLIFDRLALYVFIQLALLLAALLGIDWFIVTTFKNFSTIYQRFYLWVMVIFYAIPLLTIMGGATGAFQDLLIYLVFISSTYFSGIIVIVILNVIKKCTSCDEESLKNSYALTVANIYYLMWLPITVTAIVYFSAFDYQETEAFRAAMDFILELFNIVFLISPIVMTLALIRLDNNFKISYDLIFKRSILSYRSADDTTEEENIMY